MGLEWCAILIPVVAGWYMRHKFPHRVAWWEVVIPMLPAFLIIPLVSSFGRTMAVSDVERHGGWCVSAQYFEEWNEYIQQTCTSTDKDGNTETYDCSYVLYHPAYWQLTDSSRNVVSITKAEFESLAWKFRNRTFVDMHRWYHTIDGDQYVTHWIQGTPKQPVFTSHRFENRTLASHAVVDYPTLPKSVRESLYAYPELKSALNDPAILGGDDPEADRLLQMANAEIGHDKQCRIWIVVFRNRPLAAGFDQESLWRGGKKNEVVVTLGLDSAGAPTWCHTFCWSPDGNTSNDVMKASIRDWAVTQPKLNLKELVAVVRGEVVSKFVRKPFAELQYIRIDVPLWAFVIVYVLTIGSTVIGCVCIHQNKIRGDEFAGRWE